MPLSSFYEQRLAPLANTFLDTDDVAPYRLLRQRSFPGFFPHWLASELKLDEDLQYSQRKGKAWLVDAPTRGAASMCMQVPEKKLAPVLLGRTSNSGCMANSRFVKAPDACANRLATDYCQAYEEIDATPASTRCSTQEWLDVVDGDYSALTASDGRGLHTAAPAPQQECAGGVWPPTTAAAPPLPATTKDDCVTTLMIRNLPTDILQSDLLDELNACGFRGLYDFCYMPCSLDFGSGANRGKGYAFINFVSSFPARELITVWHLTQRFGVKGPDQGLNISAAAIQGLDENVAKWSSPRLQRIRNPDLRPFILGRTIGGLAREKFYTLG